MVKIDKISWGNVWVNGKKYHQVLIIGDQVLSRDTDKLKQLFGTTHKIGEWEKKRLLSSNPDVLLIAHGWNGVLQVDSKLKEQAKKKGIDLQLVLTGQTSKKYQQIVSQGKKVNALIHTTC